MTQRSSWEDEMTLDMTDLKRLRNEYEALLTQLFEREDEKTLFRISELSKELVMSRLGPDVLLDVHSTCLKKVTEGLDPAIAAPKNVFANEILLNGMVYYAMSFYSFVDMLEAEKKNLEHEVAEHKRAEEEVRRLNEELQVVNADLADLNQGMETMVAERTMSLMALTVADKVRNPAAIIGWTCRKIRERLDIPEKIKEALKDIIDESVKLECIVKDFETLLKSRQSIFRHEDINEIIMAALPIVKKRMEVKGIVLSKQLEEQPLRINVQRNLLRVALLHLLKNAIEATSEGGKITIATSRTNDYVTITISDAGTGIPEEYIDKIFDPFFSTKTGRFGMGLPLVKEIIQEHLGEIKVESEVGKGTTFRLIFPIRWLKR
jgi:signal transduction histidine kinase